MFVFTDDPSVDLVAEILERGNKLREAMILSTLHNTRASTNVPDATVLPTEIPVTPMDLKRYVEVSEIFHL